MIFHPSINKYTVKLFSMWYQFNIFALSGPATLCASLGIRFLSSFTIDIQRVGEVSSGFPVFWS
jgi:hypothetical protein